MDEKVNVLYIQNSALLFQSNSNSILIDGFVNNNNLFSVMPADLEDAMIRGSRPFHNIDALIYTHNHMDHYDEEKTILFSSHHKETIIVGPDHRMEREQGLKFGDFTIHLFQTLHVPVPGFPDVSHRAVLLEANKKSFFIAADMDVSDKNMKLLEELKRREITAAFLNPLILANETGRAVLREISASGVFIYHLPPEGNDRFLYREMAVQNYSKYKEQLPDITILSRPMIHLEF